jgi:hypothetical protein
VTVTDGIQRQSFSRLIALKSLSTILDFETGVAVNPTNRAKPVSDGISAIAEFRETLAGKAVGESPTEK